MTNANCVYALFKNRLILNSVLFRHCEENLIQEPKTFFQKRSKQARL